jgi:hypothetical protein
VGPQIVPHAPQFLGSVLVLTSQPSAGLPLQFAKPLLQMSWQIPLVHDAEAALLEPQTFPHAPQLLTLVLMLVSQPSAGLFVQCANPLLQANWQIPLVHVGVALFAEHLSPHPPQLLTFVLMLVSQPLAGLPSQFAKPALQTSWQTPLVHVGVALLEEQTCPHPPQLLTLVLVLVSQPSAGLFVQCAKPLLQVNWQIPLVHNTEAALLEEHVRPQPPQLLTLVPMLVSQPSFGSLLQSANPGLHTSPQIPLVHVGVALFEEQTCPHVPQFVVLVCVFAQTLEQHV